MQKIKPGKTGQLLRLDAQRRAGRLVEKKDFTGGIGRKNRIGELLKYPGVGAKKVLGAGPDMGRVNGDQATKSQGKKPDPSKFRIWGNQEMGYRKKGKHPKENSERGTKYGQNEKTQQRKKWRKSRPLKKLREGSGQDPDGREERGRQPKGR